MFQFRITTSNSVPVLLFLRSSFRCPFLNYSLASNCTCTRKLCFLIHVASPNPHLCKRLKVNFHRFHLVRQFSAFRNLQETCFVIYCLIINVLNRFALYAVHIRKRKFSRKLACMTAILFFCNARSAFANQT